MAHWRQTQEELTDGENLVAYLDDIWVVSPVPDRVSHVCGSLQSNLFCSSMVARRRLGTGAESDTRDVTRWRGSRRQQTREPVSGGGLRRQICRRHSRESWCWARPSEQRTLLERIPMVTDLQSAWLILLHCALARANYLLPVFGRQSVAAYARAHDEGVWTCICTLLNINPTQDEDMRSCANLPLVLGGVRPPGQVSQRIGQVGRLFAHGVRQTP